MLHCYRLCLRISVWKCFFFFYCALDFRETEKILVKINPPATVDEVMIFTETTYSVSQTTFVILMIFFVLFFMILTVSLSLDTTALDSALLLLNICETCLWNHSHVAQRGVPVGHYLYVHYLWFKSYGIFYMP